MLKCPVLTALPLSVFGVRLAQLVKKLDRLSAILKTTENTTNYQEMLREKC
jgi:hypothetical protein